MMGLVPELQLAMHPALDQLDAMGIDWSQYDSDGNGEIDSVVMMHSGYDAVLGLADCQGREPQNRIYAHAFAGSAEQAWVSADESMRLAAYAVVSVYDGICDDEGPATPGLTCHEYMHTMGYVLLVVLK